MPLQPIWILLSLAIGSVLPAQDAWDRADSAIVRLNPAAFPNLPSRIRDDLARRGCSIPQSSDVSAPHNVIGGSFLRPGVHDWAVLCSIAHSSRILVYRGGGIAVVDSVGLAPDQTFLQGTGEGGFAYSRVLATVSARYILSRAAAYNGPTPPLIDHQGIEDIFYGKASVIHYYHRKRWLVLQGAD
jgi:hypothetical protein